MKRGSSGAWNSQWWSKSRESWTSLSSSRAKRRSRRFVANKAQMPLPPGVVGSGDGVVTNNDSDVDDKNWDTCIAHMSIS